MKLDPCCAAIYLGLFLSGQIMADDQPARPSAVNLVRDVPGAAARVLVDSSFAGYRPDVLIDGRWIADGQGTPGDFGNADRLGNGGNTWVSAESAGEHWIQLVWTQPVQFNAVEVVWSQDEWRPQVFRVERLVNEEWIPLVPAVAGWEPTDRQSVVVTEACETRSIRVVLPRGCRGGRELLAAQEVAVFLRDKDATVARGVQSLNAQQMNRFMPALPRMNIARLNEDYAGAALALSYLADGSPSPVPSLVDGEELAAAVVSPDSIGVGVEWPVRHVVDEVVLTFGDKLPLAEAWILEFFDGRQWQPVDEGRAGKQTAEQRQLVWSFSPLATSGLRARPPQHGSHSAPSELAVMRYWPADKSTWPDRLVQRGILQQELLAGEADPSFESVAATALSMTPARTFIGTPGDAQELGVAWDGTIIGREKISFLFGQSRDRLADMRETLRRSLLDEWLPAIVTTARWGNVTVRQTVFSVAVGAEPACTATFIRLQLANLSDQPLSCPVAVDLRSERAGDVKTVDRTLRRGEDVVLICGSSTAVVSTTDQQSMLVEMDIPSRGEVTVDFVHPQSTCRTAAELDACRAFSYDQALTRFRNTWDVALRDAVRLELPEPRVQQMYRAVLAQLLINADGDIMPYGAAPSVYDGALFGIEESYAMLALAQWGLARDAQRCLDATYLTPEFLRKVETYRDYGDRHQQYRNGLEPHYAVAAYRLSHDRTWIEKHLPLLRECAEWTIEQRKKTMESRETERPLHWGLLPQWSYGGDIAEVECYALFANLCCWRGLVDTAWLLQELGDESTAQRYMTEAAAYRQDIERAIDGSYRPDRTPPFLPLRLYAQQPDEQMDYYQLFAGCMLDVEFLEPGQRHYRWITDFLEADNRVFCGLPRFRRDAGAGGLDALYGKGYLLGKLREHSVREFLLGFYAYLALNLDHDTFTSRETNVVYASDLHVRSAYTVPDQSDPVPCSSAVALHFLRHMLATETLPTTATPPNALSLLTGVPRRWLADGNTIRFDKLPTAFGETSLNVRSVVSRGQILVELQPPQQRPHSLQLWLRHPDHRPIRSVRVNGQPWTDVAADGESINLGTSDLRERDEPVRIVVDY
ncbi:MAG: discoidin domain-containing protein [Pirellulaceae bacterium]